MADHIDSGDKKRRIVWRASAGVGCEAAALAAVAVATTGSGTHAPSSTAAAQPATAVTGNGSGLGSLAGGTPLVRLVGYLSSASAPRGDATLLLRDQVYSGGLKVDVWDLHADNGDYYFSKDKGGLRGQVSGHKNRGGEDEKGRKEVVAAAKFSAKGDLNAGRKKMFLAYTPAHPKVKPVLLAPGVTPSVPASN